MTTRERSYRGLLVWRQSMEVAKACYFLTRRLPREERYGLTAQIRRASVSIPANIAEGSGRGTKRDFISFLRIAQGSLRELETYLLLLTEVNLAHPDDATPIQKQLDSIARLLNRLIQSLQT